MIRFARVWDGARMIDDAAVVVEGNHCTGSSATIWLVPIAALLAVAAGWWYLTQR